jgi:hypothetical protein
MAEIDGKCSVELWSPYLPPSHAVVMKDHSQDDASDFGALLDIPHHSPSGGTCAAKGKTRSTPWHQNAVTQFRPYSPQHDGIRYHWIPVSQIWGVALQPIYFAGDKAPIPSANAMGDWRPRLRVGAGGRWRRWTDSYFT